MSNIPEDSKKVLSKLLVKKHSYFVIDASDFAIRVNKMAFNGLSQIAMKGVKFECLGESKIYKDAIFKLKQFSEHKISPEFITVEIDIENGSPDIIFQIKELHPLSYIIVISNIKDKAVVMDSICSGANGYIIKPVSDEKVMDAMNRIEINELIKKKQENEEKE